MRNQTDIRVIPPLIPLGTMSVGAFLHSQMPVPIIEGQAVFWVGIVLALLSFLPVFLGLHALRSAKTTVDVRRNPAVLVTKGIYRYTRNPMYLALMLLCTGLAMIVNSLIMLLLVVPTGSAICLAVIRKEEVILKKTFGSQYSDYMQAVRRWA